ncbi:DUF926-domain-containing protein [Marasmius fiardii PR-910]|nr:DUF926-domain-containing protein [Marasmius fiardii PR-910]
MATVHPSRLGLVPQSSQDRTRGRPQSPPRRSSYRSQSRSRSRDQRDRDVGSEKRNWRRDEGRESGGGGHTERDDYRSRRSDRDDNSRNGYRGENRRGTPEYEDYRGPSEGTPARQESMYPNRRSRDNDYLPRGGGGSDWLESRRLQRESRTVDIWPPSPKEPMRELSPKRKGKDSKKSSKRRRYDSDSDTDSSEEERRRREKKERKRRKEKERESKRDSKKRRRSGSRHKIYDDEDDERERRRSRRSRSRKRSISRTPSPPPKSGSRTRSHTPMDDDEAEWVVKPAPDPTNAALMPPPSVPSSSHLYADDSDDEVGPRPAPRANAKKVDERSYGGALLRGEGSAMAAFLQDGNTDARIPRRGEIGLTSDQIADYESVGYVMSGSRHRRMNAVRMRKENQVISAEEKRGILKLQKEERERREAILREEFQELVKESLKGA